MGNIRIRELNKVGNIRIREKIKWGTLIKVGNIWVKVGNGELTPYKKWLKKILYCIGVGGIMRFSRIQFFWHMFRKKHLNSPVYMFHSILEFEQSWNFFHQLYNYSKKYFMRPNKIYIFRISSTRSTKWCKNLSQIF